MSSARVKSAVSQAETFILSHLKQERIAHTYLFSGPAGEAKSELVLGFAKALNCEKNRLFEACDCTSCRKIENRLHPDVHWFQPAAKTDAFKIEEIREKTYQASLRPYEGRWKVFIMEDAENLTLDAANALLKTLEEPPEHSVFFLLVENKAHLLETIQSRACEIRTPPGEEKDPRENPLIQTLEKEGWDACFEDLRGRSRGELQEGLGAILHYLKDRSAALWDESQKNSRAYLLAVEAVYQAQQAVDANANQKLVLTHLEIQIGQSLD